MSRYSVLALVLLASCDKPVPPRVYQAVAVERRDIVVSAQASGSMQPDTTVEVKSQASGGILQIKVETGQLVQRVQTMVHMHPRITTNSVQTATPDPGPLAPPPSQTTSTLRWRNVSGATMTTPHDPRTVG